MRLPYLHPQHPAAQPVVLARRAPEHRTRPMHQQAAQVPVPSLADAQQHRLAPAGVLLGHQPHRRRHIAPAPIRLPIAHERLEHTRHHRAVPRHRLQPLHRLVGPRVLAQLRVEEADVLVELAELAVTLRELLTEEITQPVLRVLHHLGQAPAQLPQPLRHHDPILRQQAPHLVAQRRAFPHPRLAQPMQRLHILLLHRLHSHKAHVRALHRLGDRARIVVIVLVPSYVRLHVLRGNQPHLVTQLPQPPRPVVRARARLHPHHARRHVREVRQHLPSPQHLALDLLAARVAPHHVKHVLCQVQTYRRNLVHGLLPLLNDGWSDLHPGAFDAEEGSGRRPSHRPTPRLHSTKRHGNDRKLCRMTGAVPKRP